MAVVTRSQDERTLYGGLYTNRTFDDFGMRALEIEGEEGAGASQSAVVSRIPLTDDDFIRLNQNLAELDAYEKRLPSFLLKYSFETGESGDYKTDGDTMDDALQEIVESIQSIISPVFSCLSMSEMLSRCQGMHLVVVTDADLARFPLTALVPSISTFASASLDFSVHIHHMRVSGEKQIANGITFVVDPRGDDDEGALSIDMLKSLKPKKGKPLVWDGIVGSASQKVGQTDWQHLLTEKCGPEKLRVLRLHSHAG